MEKPDTPQMDANDEVLPFIEKKPEQEKPEQPFERGNQLLEDEIRSLRQVMNDMLIANMQLRDALVNLASQNSGLSGNIQNLEYEIQSLRNTIAQR